MTKMDMSISFEVKNLDIEELDEVCAVIKTNLDIWSQLKYEREVENKKRAFGRSIRFRLIGKSAKMTQLEN
jgi:hypothetical protein